MTKLVKITDKGTGDILRKSTRDVPLSDIKSKYITQLKEDMRSTLASEKYGVAIAAPQVGSNLSVFLISAETMASAKSEQFDKRKHKDVFFFNPKIVKHSKKQVLSDEGCLSVPFKYSHSVPRYEKITVEYINEQGEKVMYNASGFLAKVIQHEYDHLQGRLYIDIAKEILTVDENLKPV